ncbi:MAG TPA: type II toxin-antitoxin system VapC family toxin [Tepidisphaeraceae bacterium]|nr:type II toxin-antitoxin system VapC family toxin [Tepidisphaeraceae bacterium]
MVYLLDTNALRDLLHGHVRMMERMSSTIFPHRVITSVIVRGEALFGVERMPPGRRRAAVEQRVPQLLASLDAEPVSFAAADRYARMKRAREQQGLPMDENDLWLAATTVVLGAVLVTRDGDFRKLPSLSVEDWTI